MAFAQKLDAKIDLLHVLEPASPQIEIMEAALTRLFVKRQPNNFSQCQREAVSRSRAVKAVVSNGTAADQEIVRAAQEDDVDLIIRGNHGRMGLAGLHWQPSRKGRPARTLSCSGDSTA